MKELDISIELWREYHYKDSTYRIEKPLKLYIKEGGSGHRVVDADGITHWCPVNIWHCIRWYAPEQPVSF